MLSGNDPYIFTVYLHVLVGVNLVSLYESVHLHVNERCRRKEE